ncbi:hypothetical protein T265_15641, partial [Opisthorchis viverrini]
PEGISLWEQIVSKAQLKRESSSRPESPNPARNRFVQNNSCSQVDHLTSDVLQKPTHEPHEQKNNPTEYSQQYIFLYFCRDWLPCCKRRKKTTVLKQPDSFSFALHFHLERKQFRFNGHDFLTLYLYQRRRTKSNEIPVKQLSDIPWVAKEWAVRQRPPLPLNLQWTE